MTAMKDFGTCKQAEVTILVDNRSDLIVKSTDTIKYYTDGPLLAEHGYAALIHLPDLGVKILWDAGLTETALLENMRRLEVDPDEIDLIALSHGHHDHTAGFQAVLNP